MARFLHITDLHVTAAGEGRSGSVAMLDRLADLAASLAPRADFVVASGDLTDHGDAESYALLAEALAKLDVPVLHALGNHDVREAFRASCPAYPETGSGALFYDRVIGGAHVIVLDSTVAGCTSGGLDAEQFAFLRAALARGSGAPKVLVLHHPPFSGRPDEARWTSLNEEDTTALAGILNGHSVDLILCGHIHMTRLRVWQGIPVFSLIGNHSAIDPLGPEAARGGLDIVEGTAFGICDLGPSGLDVNVLPLWPRPARVSVPASALQALT